MEGEQSLSSVFGILHYRLIFHGFSVVDYLVTIRALFSCILFRLWGCNGGGFFGLQILLYDGGGCFSSTLGSYLYLSQRRKASLQKWATEIAATGTWWPEVKLTHGWLVSYDPHPWPINWVSFEKGWTEDAMYLLCGNLDFSCSHLKHSILDVHVKWQTIFEQKQ